MPTQQQQPMPASGESRDATSNGEQSDSDETATSEQLAELTDRWRRALADLDNLRKRHARELEHERVVERVRVASEWLPVVDNLERALDQPGGDMDAMLAGIRAVRDQALDTLDRLGFPRDDEVGVPFDPNRHEVVGVVDTTSVEPGRVVEIVLPGYGSPIRQLRPAAVAVSGPRE